MLLIYSNTSEFHMQYFFFIIIIISYIRQQSRIKLSKTINAVDDFLVVAVDVVFLVACIITFMHCCNHFVAVDDSDS